MNKKAVAINHEKLTQKNYMFWTSNF